MLEWKYPLTFSLEESVRFFILEKCEHLESELFCDFFNNIKLKGVGDRMCYYNPKGIAQLFRPLQWKQEFKGSSPCHTNVGGGISLICVSWVGWDRRV